MAKVVAFVIIHVNKYDTIRTWCGAEHDYGFDGGDDISDYNSPGDPSTATCLGCLDAIMEYGERARERFTKLIETSLTRIRSD